MNKRFEELCLGTEGQGIVEYAFILLLIALAVFAGLSRLGPKVVEKYQQVASSI